MLLLSRKKNEKIMVGDNIVLTVVSVDSFGNVKLGIDAPDHIKILREELVGKPYTPKEK